MLSLCSNSAVSKYFNIKKIVLIILYSKTKQQSVNMFKITILTIRYGIIS